MTDVARSRQRWRLLSFALLALCLLTLGGAAYAVLDQGVTLTYQAEGRRALAEDLAVLVTAAPAMGSDVTRPSLLATLRRQHPTALITATDSTVGIGRLEFYFAPDGRLRRIAHPDLAAAEVAGR